MKKITELEQTTERLNLEHRESAASQNKVIDDLRRKVQQLEIDLAERKETIKCKSLEISQLTDCVSERNKTITKLEHTINQLNEDSADFQVRCDKETLAKNNQIKTLSATLDTVQAELRSAQTGIQDLEHKLGNTEQEVARLEAELQQQSREAAAREQQLQLEQREQRDQAYREIQSQAANIAGQAERIAGLQASLDDKETQLEVRQNQESPNYLVKIQFGSFYFVYSRSCLLRLLCVPSGPVRHCSGFIEQARPHVFPPS